jgi:hypothetical protein
MCPVTSTLGDVTSEYGAVMPPGCVSTPGATATLFSLESAISTRDVFAMIVTGLWQHLLIRSRFLAGGWKRTMYHGAP